MNETLRVLASSFTAAKNFSVIRPPESTTQCADDDRSPGTSHGGNRVGERVSVVEGNKLERFHVVDSRAPLAIDHNLGLDRIGDVTLLVGEVMQVFLISG